MSGATIVVGAGSAGGVVAGRLSEDAAHQVVLLEAGPDYPPDVELPADLADPFNPSLVEHDWGYQAYFLEPPESRDRVPYPRGKVVGGSSAINGTFGQRGTPSDFDAWAAAGLPEWSWERVLPYFRRLETDLDYGATEIHGDDGPVPIRRTPREEWPLPLQGLEDGFLAAGFPRCEDHNAPDATGVGASARNEIGPLRASTMQTYVREARGRDNFTLHDRTLVRRVLFGGTRAVGVEAERDGEIVRYTGDRVVLSAGAIGTPQLLQLSGVGPAEDLRRLGIDVLVDAPGVGRQLLDHPFIALIGVPAEPARPRYGFHMHLRYSDDAGQNDIWVLAAEIKVSSLNFRPETDRESVIMVLTLIGKPRSKGWLRLTSPDPRVAPELHMNFLSDPDDRRRLVRGFRRTYEVVASPPVSAAMPRIVFPAEALVEDEAVASWVLANVTTTFHGAGTCPMGPDGDPFAVTDERLRVRGTEALYVADASVMPDITNGFTNLSCFMIGERLADWLR